MGLWAPQSRVFTRPHQVSMRPVDPLGLRYGALSGDYGLYNVRVSFHGSGTLFHTHRGRSRRVRFLHV